MSRHFGYALAVPHAALHLGDTDATLAIDSAGWRHLSAYLDTVERLPQHFAAGQAGLGVAIGKLAAQVLRFGSPCRARVALRGAGHLEPAALPPDPYGGFVWWIDRLQASAASVLTILQQDVGAGARQRLQSLSDIAAAIRTEIQPLSESLGSFREALTGANRDLAAAAGESAGVLQQMQEEVGAAQVRCASLETRIASLGMLGAHRKPELMQQLLALKAALDDGRARAEQLRLQHAAIEEILNHGAWLDAALGEMAAFLEKSRGAWTTFGSGVAQLAADATAQELADPGLLDQKLDRVSAIEQWSALAAAAQGFAERALAERPDTLANRGGTP